MNLKYTVKVKETSVCETIRAISCTISPETGCLLFYDENMDIVTSYNRDAWVSCKRELNDEFV